MDPTYSATKNYRNETASKHYRYFRMSSETDKHKIAPYSKPNEMPKLSDNTLAAPS